MSFSVLATIMAALAIILLAIVVRAFWLLLPRLKQEQGIQAAPVAADRELTHEEPMPVVAPQPVSELTRLPAAKPLGERRRKIAPASSGGGDPEALKRALNNGIHAETVFRLEQSFDLLEAGRISLETYLDEIEILRRSCQLEKERLRQKADGGRTDAGRLAEAAQEIDHALEALDWCSAWVARELYAARKLAADADNRASASPDPSVPADGGSS